jgi:hypothetical protein
VKATAPLCSSRIIAVLNYLRLLAQPNALLWPFPGNGSVRDESNGAQGRYAGWAVARNQSRSVGRVPGPDCVPVDVGQGVDASSWSLMELLSTKKSTSVIEPFLPSMKFA